MKDTDVYNDELQCCLRAVVVRGENLIELYFAEHNCCDMGGAIAFSKRILPKVTAIETIAGDVHDTRYEKVGKSEWTAYVRRVFHPSAIKATS